MWPDPLHPALVHFPIVLALLAPLVAATLFWAIDTGRVPANAWLGVVLLQIVVLGAGWGTAEAGENEEERVERVVAEAPIEAHEEAAERFLWLAGLTIPIAAAGLLAGGIGRGARMLTIAACAATAFGVLQVGDSGGKLVYDHGAANAYLETTGKTSSETDLYPGSESHSEEEEEEEHR